MNPENRSKYACRAGARIGPTKLKLPITGTNELIQPVNAYNNVIMIVPLNKLPNRRNDIEINGAITPKKFGMTNGKIGSKYPWIYAPTPFVLSASLSFSTNVINARDKVTL